MSRNTGKQVLTEIVREYQRQFNLEYSDREVLADIVGPLDYSEYDYPDISTIVHNQINLIRNFLDAKIKKAKDFRSIETGLSFTDIYESVEVIAAVDVSRMDSMIGAFNLTKDKDELIKFYEYRIKMKELEIAKKQEESQLASEMLQKYQKDQNVLLIPGLSSDGSQQNGMNDIIKIGGDNSYYDELAERSTEAGIAAKAGVHDLEYYRKEIERLQSDTIPESQKQIAAKEVDKLSEGIKEKLSHWIELTNKTAAEYYDNYLFNKAIAEVSPSEIYPAHDNLKMIIAVSLAIGLMIGFLAAFMREYIKSFKKNKKKRRSEPSVLFNKS